MKLTDIEEKLAKAFGDRNCKKVDPKEVEKLIGVDLDKRKSYGISSGLLYTNEISRIPCSNCSGGGCFECGGNGNRIVRYPFPVFGMQVIVPPENERL